MFNLIVAIIAVVLGLMLSVATIYYLFFSSTASDKAVYTKYLNGSSQISSALKLYEVENGAYPTGTASDIVTTLTVPDSYGKTYLSEVPDGNWFFESGTVYRLLKDTTECKRLNSAAKMDVDGVGAAYDGCPPCTQSGFEDWPACTRPDF